MEIPTAKAFRKTKVRNFMVQYKYFFKTAYREFFLQLGWSGLEIFEAPK